MGEESVVIVGLGYVGLPLALLARAKNIAVCGIDYDKEKVKLINAGKSPFIDAEISEQLKKYPIEASNDYAAVDTVDIVVVCVPTPVDDDNMPDLTPVIASCTQISKHLQKQQLIIIESTINPGVCEEVVIPILEKNSGLKCGKDFYVAHCPERINPGDEKWHVGNIARVVGGQGQTAIDRAHAFYTAIIDAPIKKMGSLKEAEAVKIVENSFRDINIAFVNELAMSFDKLGIDIVNVIDGAATKPFAFMPHYPGLGVGGHCIPVDPYYLIEYAKNNGFDHRFLALARDINNKMPAYVASVLQELLTEQKLSESKTRVLVLGLSYKPNVGDLRESPSLELLDSLHELPLEVIASDPYIDKVSGTKTIGASSKKELKDLLAQTDVVVLATAHAQYKHLTATDFKKAGVKIVIDGRNCLDKTSFNKVGVIYRGIGRS